MSYRPDYVDVHVIGERSFRVDINGETDRARETMRILINQRSTRKRAKQLSESIDYNVDTGPTLLPTNPSPSSVQSN